MVKNSFISNFKKLPIAFLGSIVLFLVTQNMLVNSQSFWKFFYAFSQPVANEDSLRVEALLNLAKKSKEKRNILLVGSSQTREAYDIAYLNERFKDYNVEFYNLGLASLAQPIDMFMVRQRLIDINPEIIVYMPFVGSLYKEYRNDSFRIMRYHLKPSILGFMTKSLGFKELIYYRDDIFENLLGRISIFYKYRWSFKRINKRAFKYLMGLEEKPDPLLSHYTENKPQSHFDKYIEQSKDEKLYKLNKYTKLNEEVFSLFADGIVRKGVKFIVVRGPTHPLIHQTYDENIDSLFERFFLEEAKVKGFTYLSNQNLPMFEAQDFVDFTHLNALGRKKFSSFMGNYLFNEFLDEGTLAKKNAVAFPSSAVLTKQVQK